MQEAERVFAAQQMIANGTIKDRAMSMTGASAGVMKYMASLNITSVSEMTFAQRVRASTIALKEQALAWAATPMGMATIAVTSISLLISGFKAWKQNIQETRQELMQLGQQAADTNKQLYDLISQYSKLGKDGQIDLSDQETAKGIQEQIVELVGDQAKNIDLVNGKYDEEIEKLQQIKALGVGDSYNDISRAAKSAEANLRAGYTDKGFDGSAAHTIMGGSYQTKSESEAIKKVMTENGFEDFISETQGVYKFKADTTSPEKMVESYYKAVELASAIARDYGKDIENSEGALYDFYNNLNKFIDNNKEDVEAYSAAIKNLHTMDANADLAEYLKTNDINSQDAFDSYIEGIKNSTEYSDAYKRVLIDVANDAFPQFSKSAKDAGENVNKMTASLDSLSSAIKTAESAFELFNEVEKDFNSTGAISAENIQKILSKFPELEDELYEYIIGMRTGASVMDLLKTKSDDMATMSIKAFKRMYLSSNSVSKDIKDDYESAFKLIGLEWDNTQSVMANVNTQIVDANGQATQTFVEQWTEACKLAGANVSTFAQGISALLGGDFYDGTSGVYRVQSKGIYYKDGSGMDGKGTNLVNVKAMELLESGQFTSSSEAYKAAYNILSNQMDKSWENQAEFERRQKEFEEKLKQYAVTSDNKSSGSDKNEPLDNYLKYAENLYKVHQNEEKYINDLRWAYNNLTKDEKERLDIEGKIDEAYRDLSENRIKDLEHQNELLLAQGKTEYDLISNYRKIQNELHAEAERLRDMGYDNNSNEIQDLQKKWLDYDKKILDADLENSKKWIEARKNYGDWRSWGDSEVEAWGRVLKRLREDYPNAIEEIAEVEKEYRDAVLEGISRYYEDQIEKLEKKNELIKEGIELQKSQYEALLTLQQKYFENYNFVEDTKSEIQKELDASVAMYKYLDEDTRKLLFNEDDYTALSDALDKLNEENENLKTVYKSDIWSATAETIEEVTQYYEQQFELKQKEYEILKASLDVEKKRTELNNVLNERNTKMFIDGQWQWVANAEDVKNAQEALADAELEAAKTVRDKEQTLANQELESHIARLETQSNFLDKELEAAQEKWEAIEKSLEEPVTDITDILKDVAENGTPQLKSIIDNISTSLNGLNKSLGNATNIGNSSNSGSDSGGNKTVMIDGVPVVPDDNGKVLKYDKTQDKWVEIDTKKSAAVKLASGGISKVMNKLLKFDDGGVAKGKGFLAKDIDSEEIVLPPNLTRLVLNPEYSEKFKVLTQGLESMFKFPSISSNGLPNVGRAFGSTTYDNRVFIDGISLTPQESEALSSVLSRIIPNH